jgi:hypothetical protein
MSRKPQERKLPKLERTKSFVHRPEDRVCINIQLSPKLNRECVLQAIKKISQDKQPRLVMDKDTRDCLRCGDINGDMSKMYFWHLGNGKDLSEVFKCWFYCNNNPKCKHASRDRLALEGCKATKDGAEGMSWEVRMTCQQLLCNNHVSEEVKHDKNIEWKFCKDCQVGPVNRGIDLLVEVASNQEEREGDEDEDEEVPDSQDENTLPTQHSNR